MPALSKRCRLSAVNRITRSVTWQPDLEQKDIVPDVIMNVAESVDVNEDGSEYIFHLRKGHKWSDGEPVTAGQFEYAWKRAADPVTGAPYRYLFDVIKGFAEVTLDKVTVLAEEAEFAHEIDVTEAEAAKVEAEKAIATGLSHDSKEYLEAQVKLERAVNQIHVAGRKR